MKKTPIVFFIPVLKRTKLMPFLKISLWHPANNPLASVWIRGYQISRYIKNYGYTININKISPIPQIALFLRRYSKEDLKIAQNLKKRGSKIILDVVANYFQEHQFCTNEMREAFLEFVGLADQVWCCSPYLTELSQKFNPESYFISDSIDPYHFNPAIYKKSNTYIHNDLIVLGWSGYSEKAKYLNILEPFFHSNDFKFKLMIISDKTPNLNIHYDFRKWSYNKFPRDIMDCDLCVAPRELSCDYNKGHSIFKIGVFMAMGVPVLASPVPSYYLLLNEGKGGAICKTDDDWYYWLKKFYIDSQLRIKWKLEAEEIVKPYLTPVIASEINILLKKLLNT